MPRREQNNGIVKRSELIEELKKLLPYLSHEDVNLSVKIILESITNGLREERHVELRGFGSFSIHKRKPRMVVNPRSGEMTYVRGKNAPHFRPSKSLRELVDTKNSGKTNSTR